ncbi:MAG: LLM class flavin-dependent oxidoreductase [Chloroflexi bacterium]|nr:LLM class flavin-dependent oxidoreductase [Chloroflexota bacterium]MDA1146291.1 LLM class flavin-dependent oxidoreductase [Chloroflexota bacterium]
MAEPVQFGLNRWNFSSPASFALDVREGEEQGWKLALIPSSPLLVPDPYVMLAFAARGTDRIKLGPFIENPVMRHPAVLASSIATVDAVASGRTLLTLGSGDTSVRLMGKRPAKVVELEEATQLARQLLSGENVDTGARQPARLRHARRVPVWIAAGGPRTLRMAGRVADGVFIRVGRHEANLRAAVEAVHAGAREVGRDSSDVQIGVVLHTLLTNDHAYAARVGRAIAAGFYEYSPMLFEGAGLEWGGPDVKSLRDRVWPDFHHAEDLAAAGKVVDFLSDEAAAAFAVSGGTDELVTQLRGVLKLGLPISTVVIHRLPGNPGAKAVRGARGWKEIVARDVLERLQPVAID